MVIVYHGNVEIINKQLAEVQQVLDRRYREILGDTLADKVENCAKNVLFPGSFFDSSSNAPSYLKSMLRSKNNKMVLCTISKDKVTQAGIIKDRKTRTAPAFYISKEAFEHSGSSNFTDQHIASYVHEYDHFVWYALHKVPIYVAKGYLQEAATSSYLGLSYRDYYEKMSDERINPNLMTKNICLKIIEEKLVDSFEKANRILDKQILKSIGIDVPLPWRHQPRIPEPVPLPTGLALVTRGGDPFSTLNDQEAIQSFLNWEDNLRSPMRIPYISNLIDSVKGLKVSRVRIDQIDQQKKKKRK
jgi:hypothetical protein